MSKQRKQSEMFPLIKEYLSSDMTQVDFCRSHVIKVHTFQYWLTKYKEEHTGGQQSVHKFIPVQINKEQQAQTKQIRISYPSGLTIELPIFS